MALKKGACILHFNVIITDYLREKRSSTYASIHVLSLSGLRDSEGRRVVNLYRLSNNATYMYLMAQDIRTHDTVVVAIIISIIGGPESEVKLLVEAY